VSILIDTNVMLDIALRREPFFQTSALALAKARKAGPTPLCANSVTTLHYFLRKSLGETGARGFLIECLKAMPIADVKQSTLLAALSSPMSDFEDAVLAHAALESDSDLVLTRNPKDFAQSPVTAVTPEAYLNLP
jgi:predicted nucleic acid-binding protein